MVPIPIVFSSQNAQSFPKILAEEARRFCTMAGYPVLVRPSYVLSGAAMRVVTNDDDLDVFLKTAAKEVEMDGIGNAGELVNYAIAEHIENAGV